MLSLVDLFQPEWSSDPYGLYRKLREHNPVHWDDWMRTWVILGYDDIARLSNDDRLSGARIKDFYEQLPTQARIGMAPLAEALSDMMLFNEPPRHTRLRRLIKPGLTPRFVRGVRPAIEGLAEELLDRVTDSLDVIADYSEPLTRGMIARLSGTPDDAAHLLHRWPGLLHEFFTQSDKVMPRLAGLRAAFDDRIDEHRSGTGTDLFTRMIAERLAADEFTDDEIFANYLLLIDAGQATTTHLIGNAVLALLRNPDQLELLRKTPDLAANAAHELMRYDTSVQFTSRIALADIDIADQHINEGDSVTLVLGSGNRDPRHYDRPDELDITRKANDHLSFGHGIHYCLGAALSLAEIEIAITALLRRADDMTLLRPEPEWLDSINFRFMKSLPIRYTRTRAGD